MKKGLSGLFAVLALSCCGMAFAEVEGVKEEQPAVESPKMGQQAPQQSKTETPSGEKIKSTPTRPKDLDLRHCLELKDDAAIAKCAGE